MGITVVENLPGDGQTFPKDGDVCVIQYTGSYASNKEQFDSSHDHSQSGEFEFSVGTNEVIRGPVRFIMFMCYRGDVRAHADTRANIPYCTFTTTSCQAERWHPANDNGRAGHHHDQC